MINPTEYRLNNIHEYGLDIDNREIYLHSFIDSGSEEGGVDYRVAINFEKNILLKHSRLTDLIKLNDDEMLAVFDFSDLTDDWNNLLKGKYSKLTINVKRKISTYFQNNTANQVYINSYLYPKDYFEIYSELLQVDISLLKEVGELCSKPDLEKEILYQKVQDLQITKILD